MNKNREKNMQGSRNKIVIVVAVLGAVVSALVSVLVMSEFIIIGMIADPNTVAGYYFGSETMLFHGGWKYQSSSVYAWTAFVEGIFLWAVTTLLVWSARKRSLKGVITGYLMVLVWYAGIWWQVI
jgi:Co/Zn/Cd efflux system component